MVTWQARMLPGGLDSVASVLLNPTPANTFVDPLSLRVCDRRAVPNEACLRNDIEVHSHLPCALCAPASTLPPASDVVTW